MNWLKYKERMQLYFEANDIPEGERKAVFLSCCRGETYGLLRGLFAPRKPVQEALDTIYTALTNHHFHSLQK